MCSRTSSLNALLISGICVVGCWANNISCPSIWCKVWSISSFSWFNLEISLSNMEFIFWIIWPACAVLLTTGVSSYTDSNFGITSLRRTIISSASWRARAFADSSFLCSASWRAASAARLVFSHSSNTSSMVIWPVTCCSSCAFSFITRLICPSDSSPNNSWKLILKDPSISSSVSIWNADSFSASSSSVGNCKYGISSTIFLILSIVPTTVSFSGASRICCIPLAISSCKFDVLNLLGFNVTCGIATASCAYSPALSITSELMMVLPSFSWRKSLYFSSCVFVRGWYNILSSNARST